MPGSTNAIAAYVAARNQCFGLSPSESPATRLPGYLPEAAVAEVLKQPF